MIVETQADIDALMRIGRIVANVLHDMIRHAAPGMSTLELDRFGEALLTAAGAVSAPRFFYKFPGATCISVGSEVAHGIPTADRVLSAGEILNIDVSATMDGYVADTGASFVLPPAPAYLDLLCEATLEAMRRGIAACREGAKLSGIGKAVQGVARETGHSVILNLGSHGVGRSLHEEPKFIPSFFDARETRILQKGCVMTVEPFLSNGASYADESTDGWTLTIPSGHRGAQYEHTLIVTEDAPLLVTIPDEPAFVCV